MVCMCVHSHAGQLTLGIMCIKDMKYNSVESPIKKDIWKLDRSLIILCPVLPLTFSTHKYCEKEFKIITPLSLIKSVSSAVSKQRYN